MADCGRVRYAIGVMKKQVLTCALVATLAAMAASACDGGSGYVDERERGNGGSCEQYASCGTCTPVSGCGWCTTSTGQGLCAADPNECAGASDFNWTWDPSGCLVTADAGVAASTGGGDGAAPSETGASEGAGGAGD
jgi:hypothetical protein